MLKSKLVLTAAIALLALVSAAGGAHAFTINVEPGERIALTSVGRLTFTAGVNNIACELTMGGTLARGPYSSVSETQIGSLTEGSIGSCSNGSIRRNLLLPWRIVIRTVLGTGPSEVTGLLYEIVGWSQLFNIGGVLECLFEGTLGILIGKRLVRVIRINETTVYRYEVTEIRTLERIALRRGEGGGFCPETMTVAGRLALSPTQAFDAS